MKEERGKFFGKERRTDLLGFNGMPELRTKIDMGD